MSVDANCVLLLTGIGSNGGQTFDDLSIVNRDPTVYGNVQTSTSQYKYAHYGSSIYFDGSDDYLTIPALGIGATTDFCCECWVYYAASHGADCLFSQQSSQGFVFYITSDNRLQIALNWGGGYGDWFSTSTVSIGAWHHIALSRNGDTWRAFIDGVLAASHTQAVAVPSTTFYVGYGGSASWTFGAGYMQDIRVVVGEPVYTADFTPPYAFYGTANGYFSADDDVGSFAAFAEVELGPDLGYLLLDDTELLPLFALADLYVYRAWLASDSDLGTFQALAYPVAQGFFDTASNDIGTFKAVGSVPMDEWAAAGFPCPTRTRFSYMQGPGLVRTTFEAGNTWQRRRWTSNYRECEVGFQMSRDLLPAVETFLDARGYDWFQMGLTTGAYDQSVAAPTRVRVKENPKLSGADGEMFELTLTLEVDSTL